MDSRVEENYKRMRSELNERLNSDKRLTAILEKINNGTATFKDSAEYSQIVANHMGDVISKNIGSIKVPMGKEMVCKELLKENIERVDAAFGKVQVSVDEKMGIHLNPVKPPYPTDRVNAIAHSLEDPNASDEKIARRGKSTGTIVAARHDENVKANANWREKAGFDCYLTRDAGGGCCPWCATLEGRFSYADAPDDIFRRHDHCTCIVTYECGRKRQDVWSKKTWEADPKDIEARKAASEAARPTVKTPAEAQAINEQSKSNITVLSKEQAEALNEQHKPTVLTEAEAKEREAMALGKGDSVNNFSLEKQGESGIIKSSGNYDFCLITPTNDSPKTNYGSSSFSKELLERLKSFEEEVCSDRYETALIINPNGEEFTVTSGLTNKVHFTYEQLDKMNGCVLSHNHFDGTTFSPEDITILFETKLEEIRACNKEGTFVMRLPPSIEQKIDIDYVNNALKEYDREAVEKFRLDYINGNITLQEYDVMVQQYSVEQFAKAHKCDYYFERRS